MRDVEITIFNGSTRRQLAITLSELGTRYRDGVGRARISQIEKSAEPTATVARDYCIALRLILASRRRKGRRTGF
jgi:hypothetical protein